MSLERKVLSENDRVAARLRARFAEHHVLCLNLLVHPDRERPVSSNALSKTSTTENEWPFLPETFRRKTTRNAWPGSVFP